MPNTEQIENQQQIVTEYFEKQKDSKLMLCIYQESLEDDDIEWFYDGENWCFIKETEVKNAGPNLTEEVYEIIRKADKKFNKDCYIETLSFRNYMIYQCLNLHHKDYISTKQAQKFIDKFMDLKKTNEEQGLNYTMVDYIKYVTQKQWDTYCWILTVVFLLIPYCFIISFFTCPLLRKFRQEKLKISPSPDSAIIKFAQYIRVLFITMYEKFILKPSK